jgi:Flp pilus assembly protein TadD
MTGRIAAAFCLALLSIAAAPPPVEPAANVSAALPIIDAAIDAGRLEDAASIVARLAATHDGPELRLRSAELALASAAPVEAIAGFSPLTEVPETAARAYQGLGLAQYRLGDKAAAQKALGKAIAADPSLLRSWLALGAIADGNRDFAAADAAYAKALAIDPNSAAALTNRGYSLLLRGRAGDAEADLLRATMIDPGLATAQTNLRVARAMQGKYREAFAGSNKQSLAADLNNVGFGALARGDTRTAETYFNRALSLNPRFDAIAWANLRYLKSLTQPLGTGVDDEEKPQ